MSQHTPGPWTLDKMSIYANEGRVKVADLATIKPADAPLMAAAPELLEALEAIAKIAGERGDEASMDIAHLARAAIAKAKEG
jgi:hypothetical protein